MLSKGIAYCALALVHAGVKMSLLYRYLSATLIFWFLHHLLLIFFRSAKLTFIAKGKGPFFAQNFKLVCDNYLDPLHLLSRKPEALCCTLIQCQLGTRARGGGVLQGGRPYH